MILHKRTWSSRCSWKVKLRIWCFNRIRCSHGIRCYLILFSWLVHSILLFYCRRTSNKRIIEHITNSISLILLNFVWNRCINFEKLSEFSKIKTCIPISINTTNNRHNISFRLLFISLLQIVTKTNRIYETYIEFVNRSECSQKTEIGQIFKFLFINFHFFEKVHFSFKKCSGCNFYISR